MTNIHKGITFGICFIALQLATGYMLESQSRANAGSSPLAANSSPTTKLAQRPLGGGVNQSQLVSLIASQMVTRVNQMSCTDFRGSLNRLQNSQNGQNSGLRARLLDALQAQPDLRRTFIDAIAAPLTNKMFDCGLVPPP